ncbi:DNA replication/repair protein RecF [Flexibacterium corallicola]|uniref:DNA replication/repair protein RecF n=1 Tax=Flexibacterium corallicola TaxID=3037259 RepID=UPI00286F1720|nr:DNA replication/repair protein RecF [Pseudovibrio sp. M1P-2-3]
MLTSISLTDFRNYKSASVSLNSNMVAFTGSNGAGKTNILEAISLLTVGRGIRRANLADMARADGAGSWAVSALLSGEYGDTRMGTGYSASEPSRKLRIEGEDMRSSESLLEYLRIIWLIPSMDSLFTGSAGDRRKFLDRLVLSLHPSHGRMVSNFERALRQRNRLLQDGGDSYFLDAIEAQVAELGTAVSLARRETVSLLAHKIGEQVSLGLPFPQAEIGLQGSFEDLTDAMAASDCEDCFKDLLKSGRMRDKASGRTLDGPHRSDLDVVHADKGLPAAIASTGEQKALLIGLILAHADLTKAVSGLSPVLLLDEVAAHLDPNRREALFSRLNVMGGQVFMTGTDAMLFNALPPDAQIFEVSDACVSLKQM